MMIMEDPGKRISAPELFYDVYKYVVVKSYFDPESERI